MQPGPLSHLAQEIKEAAEHHRGKDYVSDTYLDFFLELSLLHLEEGGGIADLEKTRIPDEDQAQQRLAEGFFLLDPDHVAVHEDEARKMLGHVAAVYRKYNPPEAAEADAFEKAADAGRVTGLVLVQHGIHRHEMDFEALGREGGVTRETALFFSENLARPALRSLAALCGDRVLDKQWLKGYCPVCGNWPNLGFHVGEEGVRLLHCSMCGFVWTFRRLVCPHCDCEEQDRQRYLFTDPKSPYRVDVCNKCKIYLKTVDLRKDTRSAPLVPWIEDPATLFLDIMANKEGYKRP